MRIFHFLKSKSFFLQIAIAIVGLCVVVFALKYWLGFFTNHDQKIQVPDLHKMSLEAVERELTNINLDFIVIDSASYNPNYPKKSVIDQSPKTGDFVKEKRKIYLTLNPSKYRNVTLPDLNGKTKRQAISHLRSIGLAVGVNYTYVNDIGKNVVRGLRYKGNKINQGDKLPLKSVIELILGDGRGR
jgi:eukaryotic-like serine/threonine-protein kinase